MRRAARYRGTFAAARAIVADLPNCWFGPLVRTPAAALRNRGAARYAATFATEMAVLLLNMVTLRLAATLFGPTGFGGYSVAKRAVNVLTYPLLLGLGIAFPKFVAQASAGSRPGAARRAYVAAWGWIAALSLGLFSILATLMRGQLTQAFFGSSSFEHFAAPIVLCTVGLYLQTGVYAYFRALLRMDVANTFRFLTSGVVPLASVAAAHGSPARALFVLGSVWTASALLPGVAIAARERPQAASPAEVLGSVTQLLVYGLPRVPGELALFGLFSLPPIWASHRLGVEAAGFVSFGLSLVQYLGALFSAASILLLPYLSRLAALGEWRRIKQVVGALSAFSLLSLSVIVAAGCLASGVLVRALLGESFSPAEPLVRVLLLSSVPYGYYVVVRSALDSLATWPHNSINLTVSLAVLLVFLQMGTSVGAEAAGVCVGLVVLAALSYRSWHRVVRSVEGRTAATGRSQGSC